MKYRKKPVVIEAIRVTDVIFAAAHDWASLPQWIQEASESKTTTLIFLSDGVEIITLEGAMKAGVSDWIIRGVKNELYPCKPDIFDATYEAVEDQDKESA